jgi:CheY-like chemotaxis protein
MRDPIGSRWLWEQARRRHAAADFLTYSCNISGRRPFIAKFGAFCAQMKILVVEDEPLIRLGLASAIEEAGYEVTEAANADEAVRRLEAQPDIMLVLTDVDMPGSMDGIRLAHYVRDRWPPVQLIVISGKVGVKPGQLPPGARFVGKPYQEPALLGLVETMVAQGGGAA